MAETKPSRICTLADREKLVRRGRRLSIVEMLLLVLDSLSPRSECIPVQNVTFGIVLQENQSRHQTKRNCNPVAHARCDIWNFRPGRNAQWPCLCQGKTSEYSGGFWETYGGGVKVTDPRWNISLSNVLSFSSRTLRPRLPWAFSAVTSCLTTTGGDSDSAVRPELQLVSV